MTIKFDGIPSSTRKPGRYMEFNTRLASSGLPSGERNMVMIAQKTSAGRKAALTPIQVYSETDVISYFGAGSIAHRMYLAANNANKYADISIVALDDAADSAAATGTVTFTGPATSSGQLDLHIGADVISFAIASAATATDIAAIVKAALDNLPALPVTAVAASGVLTLTAKNKGTLGNAIIVSAEITAPGVTATVAVMAGGLVDPDLDAGLEAVEAARYHRKVSPFNTKAQLDKLKTHIEFVSGPLEQRGGIGIAGYVGDLEDALPLAEYYGATGRMKIAYVRGIKSLPYEFAASEAAVDISESDPARPLNGLPLTGIDAPAIEDRLGRGEQESCLHGGLTPHEVNSSGELVIVRSISTYTVNAEDVEDDALLDTTSIDTLDYARAAVEDRMALRFPRSKLPTRLLPVIEVEIYDVLKEMENLEILEDIDANREKIALEKDLTKRGWLSGAVPLPVVPGLHVFALRGDLIL